MFFQIKGDQLLPQQKCDKPQKLKSHIRMNNIDNWETNRIFQKANKHAGPNLRQRRKQN